MLIPLRYTTSPPSTESLLASSVQTSPIFSVYLLIVVNMTVFSWQLLSQHIYDLSLIQLWSVVPFDFLASLSNLKEHIPRLLYALFLHDIRFESGFLHLIGNMLYLLAFGPDLELRVGRWMFLLFYLLSGVLSTIVHICFHPDSISHLIGASGAIAGIMGAHLAICRDTKIRAFFFIAFVSVSTTVVLSLWIALQIASAYLAPMQSSVAWSTHISGFIIGLLIVQLSQKNGMSDKTLRSVDHNQSHIGISHNTCHYTSQPFTSSNTYSTEDEASSVYPLYPLAQPLRVVANKQKRQKRNKKC